MLKLDDFKKLPKSKVINTRFVRGGNVQQTEYTGGDDWAWTTQSPSGDHVIASGHVPRGGNEEADPHNGTLL